MLAWSCAVLHNNTRELVVVVVVVAVVVAVVVCCGFVFLRYGVLSESMLSKKRLELCPNCLSRAVCADLLI